MVQKGDLRNVPFPKVLGWLIKNQKNGTLKVRSGTISKFLFFKSGRLLSAYSEDPKDRIWRFFYKEGSLTEEQIQQVEQERKRTKEGFERIVLRRRLAPKSDVLRVLQLQSAEIAVSIFDWTQGTFWYYQDKFPTRAFVTVGLPMQGLLQDGLKRLENWRAIRSTFRGSDQINFASRDRLLMALGGAITPLEQRVLRLVKRGITVDEIVAHSPFTGFETLSTIHRIYTRSGLTIRHTDGTVDEVAEEPLEREGSLVDQATRYHAAGEYWKAFNTIKQAFVTDSNDPLVQRRLKEYSDSLAADLRAKIGNLNRVPRMIRTINSELWKTLDLDATDGYIVSRVDGQTTLKDMFSIVKINPKKILTTIYRLLGVGVLVLRDPGEVDLASKEGVLAQIETLHAKIREQSHYERLDVAPEASEGEIKKAYFSKAKIFHPDAIPQTTAEMKKKIEEVFNNIQQAYRTLTDPRRRHRYDIEIGLREETEKDRAVARMRERARVQYSIGRKAYKSRNYARAMEFFRSAIDLDPEEPMYWANVAEICMRNPRWFRTGKKAAQRSIDLAPENPAFYNILGLLLKKSGDLVSAEEQFRHAINLEPNNLVARRELQALGHKLSDIKTDEIRENLGRGMAVKKPRRR